LDCPDVRRGIHWGPSEDIEMHLRKTGRAGWNGIDATNSYSLQYSWGKTCTLSSFHERVYLKQRGVQTNDASKRLWWYWRIRYFQIRLWSSVLLLWCACVNVNANVLCALTRINGSCRTAHSTYHHIVITIIILLQY
jgi:hypothetical protein